MSGSPPDSPTRACRCCGYVLDGLPAQRCPECGLAFEPGDPSTFVHLSPPAVMSWPQWSWRLGLLAGLVLVYSMGFYSTRQGTTLDRNGRSSREREVFIGLPLTWLTWRSATDTDVTTTSPWGFQPGVEIAWPPFGLALGCGLLVAIPIERAMSLVRQRFPATAHERYARIILLAAAAGGGVGCAVPTEPEWLGALLAFGLLPVWLAMITWRRRSYGCAFLAAGAAVLSLIWWSRIGDFFRYEHLVPNRAEDLLGTLFFGVVYTSFLLFVTWLHRAFAKPTHASTG